MQKVKEEQKKAVETDKAEQKQKIKIFVGRLGGDAKQVEVDEGTTVREIVKANGFEGLEIRVDSQDVPLSTPVKENQVVVAVPEAIVGGR